MIYNKITCMYLIISVLSIGCQSQSPKEKTHNISSQFSGYWYAGKAEVGSYRLEQSRYGEVRQGTAVLIFVTEDFSRSKQVKLDHPHRTPKDKLSVLKLNFTKNFLTGVYPYSMLQSVFTPIHFDKHPHTLKTTMSVQEWCGHTYTQLNLSKKQYKITGFSYFESEGDQSYAIPIEWLEDELWNRIRLDYRTLPIGEIDIIPGSFYARLHHKNIKAKKATALLTEHDDSYRYELQYTNPKRTLRIDFAKKFPHKILSWIETTQGLNGKEATTKATLIKTLHIDYWNKNSNKYNYLRDSLNLK